MRKLLLGTAMLACGLFAANASATVYRANDIVNGNTGQLAFTPNGGQLGLKTVSGATGVGVTGGASGNEIDIGQSITVTATGAWRLNAVTLAFLFDGPEYGDVQETARLSGVLASGGTRVATVTNHYVNGNDLQVLLDVDGHSQPGLIQGATKANNSFPAEVTLGALFGESALTSLSFEALTGDCGHGNCNNQSDYGIASIDATDQLTAVPEPGAVGLMGLGLIALGFLGWRRRVG